MKGVLLCRVSTVSQDYERQITELTAYAASQKIEIVKIFANKISGAKKNEDRPEILEMIEYVKSNQVDKVLVLEISRLGRNTLEALKVIELLNENKICLYVKNYGIETLDEKGNINPMAQFLCTILLEVARMERTTIKQRMESGYQNFRNKGGKVGRKEGYRKTDEKLKQGIC
jgi:DNA invertase Pin-like site-specific DNA recombinase